MTTAGETAGLRVPRAGLNQHKQPLWMCHGCLFRSARPETSDIGGEAREEGPAPMDRYVLHAYSLALPWFQTAQAMHACTALYIQFVSKTQHVAD